MGDILRIIFIPAALALALAAAGWLRRPLHDAGFEARDLAAPPLVRVGVVVDAPSIPFQVDGHVRVTDPTGREVFWQGPAIAGKAAPLPDPGPGIRLTGQLAVPFDEVLVLPARDGTLQIGTTRYRGTLRLAVRGPKRQLTAVNELDLERYLQGVITSEMRPHWPPEALMAQAVVARTYALYEILNGYVRSKRGFDVFDDDNSQLYRGIAGESPESEAAARATSGLVLRWQGRPFKAFYQNTCGGRTEAAKTVFLEQDIPPLAGTECAHCGRSKHFRWRIEVPKASLAAKLFGPKAPGPVAEMRVLEKAPGGLVLKAVARIGGRTPAEKTMTGKELRSAVDPAKFKSLAFDVTDGGGSFIFEGRGWGHLVGLCQEGARGFAEDVPGATFRQILDYYYPGAVAGRIY
jgi:stage II sporulation protein D